MINPRSRLFSFYFLFFVFVFLSYRIFFLYLYQDKLDNASIGLILKSILVGFRFDFSVIAAVLSPFYFLSLIFPLNRYKLYQFIWGFTPI
ncbi:MAG TPA: alkaline phosphatase, partial [Leptospiraceae bacterium]|nr:alkaline phosphatase [Leptospiraceae bacterium]